VVTRTFWSQVPILNKVYLAKKQKYCIVIGSLVFWEEKMDVVTAIYQALPTWVVVLLVSVAIIALLVGMVHIGGDSHTAKQERYMAPQFLPPGQAHTAPNVVDLHHIRAARARHMHLGQQRNTGGFDGAA
jgi:hypothetical protein